jgi:WD40 repeat protein
VQAADFENQPFTWDEVPSAEPSPPAVTNPENCPDLGYRLSPDGTLLATFCYGEVFVWDTTTPSEFLNLLYFMPCDSDIRSVAHLFHWTPQYFYIQRQGAVCDSDLMVWNPRTGETVFNWEPQLTDDPYPASEPLVAAWSSDWTQLAIASYDELQILNTTTWETLHTYPAVFAEDSYPVMAWSPDNSRIAITLDSRSVQIWDAATGVTTATLENTAWFIRWLAWSPDGSRLATIESYGRTHIWDVVTGQMLMTLPTPDGSVSSILWKPDGTQLAATDYYGGVTLWDVR